MENKELRIAIASDHAGYLYKEAVRNHLRALGYEVLDFGAESAESVDYPVFIRPAAEAVASGDADLAIVFGGSGNGEAMVANKVKGVRCAVCWDEYVARMAKEHNNANVISIGERTISEDLCIKIVDTWLNAKFQGGRHERRINQIEID